MTNSTKINKHKLAIAVRRIRNLDEISDNLFALGEGQTFLFPEDRAPFVAALQQAYKGAAEDLYAVFHPTETDEDVARVLGLRA